MASRCIKDTPRAVFLVLNFLPYLDLELAHSEVDDLLHLRLQSRSLEGSCI